MLNSKWVFLQFLDIIDYLFIIMFRMQNSFLSLKTQTKDRTFLSPPTKKRRENRWKIKKRTKDQWNSSITYNYKISKHFQLFSCFLSSQLIFIIKHLIHFQYYSLRPQLKLYPVYVKNVEKINVKLFFSFL